MNQLLTHDSSYRFYVLTDGWDSQAMPELALHGGPAAAAPLDVPDWPEWTERSEENILDAGRTGSWCRISDDADWVAQFESEFADFHDAEHAIGVANGTVALELALRACGVEPGDEVIVPGYTFIATASAVVGLGAVPRFADIDPNTYNLDTASVDEQVTDDTVGVVGVHFAGYPIDFDELLPVIDKHDLFLVEDAAHAQGTEWKGRKVGAIGDAGAFSFQETKALAGGEGGIVVTNDDVIAEDAELAHNIGRVPGRPGYRHYVQASNYRLTEFQGALLSAQLEKLPEENRHRQRSARRLVDELSKIEGISTKPTDERITNRGYCIFNFTFDAAGFDGLSRDAFLEALNAEGVPATDGYGRPLYQQPAFSRSSMREMIPTGTEIPAYRHLHHPGTEQVAERAISLPHEVLLADERGIDAIADAVRKVQRHADELQ